MLIIKDNERLYEAVKNEIYYKPYRNVHQIIFSCADIRQSFDLMAFLEIINNIDNVETDWETVNQKKYQTYKQNLLKLATSVKDKMFTV